MKFHVGASDLASCGHDIGAKIRPSDSIDHMVTPDKDFFQLIDKNISICKLNKPGKDYKFIGITELRNSFAVANAIQISDIMALTGDRSDNIPAIAGIGNRNARKLISQFGSISNIYANIDKLSPKLRDIFVMNKERIELSKKLVTIEVNVPIDVDIERLAIQPIC